MKKHIITSTAIVLLATSIIFSCKKKETTPEDTANTVTTTGTTTGSTTGGSVTNTLTTNTWMKGNTTYTTSTVNIFGLAFTSKNQYYYSCVDNNNSMNSLEVFLYSNAGALPTTGTYTIINGLINQTATLTPNQAFINIPGTSGGASTGTGTLSVTNTNSVVTIIGSAIPFTLLPSGTTSVSLNIQK